MKYKVGDKFVWKEGRCCTDFYKNDEYELRYDEKTIRIHLQQFIQIVEIMKNFKLIIPMERYVTL